MTVITNLSKCVLMNRLGFNIEEHVMNLLDKMNRLVKITIKKNENGLVEYS